MLVLYKKIIVGFLFIILLAPALSSELYAAKDTASITELLEKLKGTGGAGDLSGGTEAKGSEGATGGLAGLAASLRQLKEKLLNLLGKIQEKRPEQKTKKPATLSDDIKTKLEQRNSFLEKTKTTKKEIMQKIREQQALLKKIQERQQKKDAQPSSTSENSEMLLVRGYELQAEILLHQALLNLAQLVAYDVELYDAGASQGVDDNWLFDWTDWSSTEKRNEAGGKQEITETAKLSYFRRLTAHGSAQDEAQADGSEIDFITLTRLVYGKTDEQPDENDENSEDAGWIASLKSWIGLGGGAANKKSGSSGSSGLTTREDTYEAKNKLIKYNLIQKTLYLLAKMHDQLARALGEEAVIPGAQKNPLGAGESTSNDIATREKHIINALNLAIDSAGQRPEIMPVVDLITQIFLPASTLISVAISNKKKGSETDDLLSREVDAALEKIAQESEQSSQPPADQNNYLPDNALLFLGQSGSTAAQELRRVVESRSKLLKIEYRSLEKSISLIQVAPALREEFAFDQVLALVRLIDQQEQEAGVLFPEGKGDSSAGGSVSSSKEKIDQDPAALYLQLRRQEHFYTQLKTQYEELFNKTGLSAVDNLNSSSQKSLIAPDAWSKLTQEIADMIERKNKLGEKLNVIQSQLNKSYGVTGLVKELDKLIEDATVSESVQGSSIDDQASAILEKIRNQLNATASDVSKQVVHEAHDLCSYVDPLTGKTIVHKLVLLTAYLLNRQQLAGAAEGAGAKQGTVTLAQKQQAQLKEILSLLRTTKPDLFIKSCYLGITPYEQALLAKLPNDLQKLFALSNDMTQNNNYKNALGWSYEELCEERSKEAARYTAQP